MDTCSIILRTSAMIHLLGRATSSYKNASQSLYHTDETAKAVVRGKHLKISFQFEEIINTLGLVKLKLDLIQKDV